MVDNFAEKELDEAFALPIGLKPIVKYEGKTFYGSDALNKNVIKALAKSQATKSIYQALEKMVNNGIIIPFFFTKDVTQFLLWKIFAPKGLRKIAAFYAPSTKKVYLAVQNEANLFAYISNNYLGETVIHELMHLIAGANQQLFYRTFKTELEDFYYHMWSLIFSLKDADKKITNDFVKWLFFTVEAKARANIFGDLIRRLDKLRPYSQMRKEDFDKVLKMYVYSLLLYFKDPTAFRSTYSRLLTVMSPIYAAYKKTFNEKNDITMCVQELMIPSEVIAVMSEKMALRKKALSIIKMAV